MDDPDGPDLEDDELAHVESEGEGGDDAEDDRAADLDAALVGLKGARAKKVEKKLSQKKKKLQKKKTQCNKMVDDDPLHGYHEAADFSPTISTRTKPPISREKHCLDDFICCLNFARQNMKEPIAENDCHRTKRFLLSLFLELAWSGAASINGKTFRMYSSFRDEAQKLFYNANKKLEVGNTSYDPLDLASSLLKMIQTPAWTLASLSTQF